MSYAHPRVVAHSCFQIEFDVDADPGDLDERMRFWDSTRDWFSDKGYTLYKAVYTENEYAGGTDFAHWIPSLGSVEDYIYEHPYAHVCGDPSPHECAVPLSGEADVHVRLYDKVRCGLSIVMRTYISGQDSVRSRLKISACCHESHENQLRGVPNFAIFEPGGVSRRNLTHPRFFGT